MRVLIVGGGGFLGRRVVARFQALGHEPAVFDAARPAGDAKFVAGDVGSMDDVSAALAETRPQTIVQLASLLGPETADEPYRALGVNVDGMTNVLEAARVGGVGRVVFASSVVVHGPQRLFGDAAVTEGSPVAPRAPYAAMKWFNERVAEMFARRYQLETVAVRLSNLFGFGRVSGTSGPWADAIATGPALGRAVQLAVSPELRTSLLYVDDAAEYVTRLALADERPADVYLTGGYAVSVGELADAVRAAVPGAQIAMTGDAPGDVPAYLVDNARIVADTGHQAPSLIERVRDHIAEARAAASERI